MNTADADWRDMRQPDLSREAVKWDEDKARTDLLPPRPLMDIAEVLTFGAKKYTDRNWELGFRYGRPFSALLRHLFAWWRGEDNDPETGMSHLAHAGCCLLMLMEFRHSRRGTDDRPRLDVGSYLLPSCFICGHGTPETCDPEQGCELCRCPGIEVVRTQAREVPATPSADRLMRLCGTCGHRSHLAPCREVVDRLPPPVECGCISQ